MLETGIKIIVMISICAGYVYRRKSLKEKRQNEYLVNINDELMKVNHSLNKKVIRTLRIWEQIHIGEYLTKEEIAKINNIPYEEFEKFTSKYQSNAYREGIEAIYVQNEYYKNSGKFNILKKKLKKVNNQLENIENKNSQKYRVLLIKFRALEEVLESIQKPKGSFFEYKSAIYSKQKVANL